jgi:hypothetical protein
LTDETIARAEFRSLTDSDDDAGQAGYILRWGGAGPVPALVLPYFGIDGQQVAAVLRPDKPRTTNDSKPIKYEWPHGLAPRLYFPQPSIGKVLTEPAAQWTRNALYKDTSKPLLITEGIKKALAAQQTGALEAIISGQGVTIFHDTTANAKWPDWKLHPDFTPVMLKGRMVYIAFDGSDTTNNAPVIMAEARLARLLMNEGAIARLVRIPFTAKEKVGLDDYLVKQADPTAALSALLAAALPADPVERASDARAQKTTRVEAAQRLMADLGFVAALDAGGDAIVDGAHQHLRDCGIRLKTLKSAIFDFHHRFRADEETERPDSDPELVREGEKLLRDAHLVQRFYEDLGKNGLVGERNAALTVLLSAVSRRSRQPLHLVLKAPSSAGKSFVVNRVLDFIPGGDVLRVTDMTPHALQYLPDSVKDKVVFVAEQHGAERADYSVRILQSEGALEILVPEKVQDDDGSRIETHARRVEGPCAFITTTTRDALNDENETRILEVNLDESEEQTKDILTAQARSAVRPPSEAYVADALHKREVWRTALALLEVREVAVPQADELAARLPPGRIRSRRDFGKLLGLVRAHALLHQRRREVRDGFVVATDEDTAAAQALAAALLDRESPRLMRIFDKLKGAFGAREFTTAAAAAATGYSCDGIRVVLHKLADLEKVAVVEKAAGSRGARWKIPMKERYADDDDDDDDDPDPAFATPDPAPASSPDVVRLSVLPVTGADQGSSPATCASYPLLDCPIGEVAQEKIGRDAAPISPTPQTPIGQSGNAQATEVAAEIARVALKSDKTGNRTTGPEKPEGSRAREFSKEPSSC